ncbi:helix-turn-helix domain-containing protein [Humitalea sp. 24SJ18S-53]|uniref:helix-turn-helix domain-containing protein n=1 Tax=Humitalea sp. 24SJ18S-53 TaxID=3422307 RepID=UPI003D667D33
MSDDDLDRYPGIGERLRAHRLGLGLSAEAMAERLRVSRTALYRYERGEPPKLPMLERAAAVLGLPLGTLLGVGVEWFASPLAFFERLRQVEEVAEQLFVLFGPLSLLLTSDDYDALMPELVAEALPPGQDPAPLLATLRRRKATWERRRPGVISMLSLPEVERTLADGIAARHDLPPAVQAARRAAARAEILHVARLAEAPPRGVQIGLLLQSVPTTGFSLARARRETALAVSPFRLGGQSNLATGIALVTSAPDAVRLHDDVAEKLWRESIKGDAAAGILRRAVAAAE